MSAINLRHAHGLLRAWAAAALLGGTALGLAGCGRPQGAAVHSLAAPAPAPGVHLWVVQDDSKGFQPHLGEGVDLAVRLSALLEPGTDRLTLTRLNYRADDFFDDAPPDGVEALQDLEARTFRAPPSRDGTRPVAFWGGVPGRAASESRACVLVYLSDGDQDFAPATEDPRLRAAGTALAANPRVAAVILCGLTPDNWAAWRRRFPRLDAGGRLHLVPLDASTFDRIAAFVDAARSAGGETSGP